ncbi:hypothetical protein T440DRAFT_466069 [Plenodomus tracheiphilus IPT5]|uniref:Uncharacterized protein n=1 Tax=Plenodomus tracheiphilus IPT5 TaxID=1408161 RepID=A0A6A7BCE1_9PLEO|nr:hypothetical protein T440DRAFT_466069 [Plenodomus tracheiphilus IPT5]
MIPFLPTLLFVAAVTAQSQLTTTFWAPVYPLGTDKIGYYGSVINANASHTTYFLTFDDGTDYEAQRFGYLNLTMTVGPNIWEQSTTLNFAAPGSTTAPNANAFIHRCEREDPTDQNANAICTESYGPNYLYAQSCDAPQTESRTEVFSRTVTYSGRLSYSAGVETIVETFAILPDTAPAPAWCTDDAALLTGSATTFEYLSTSFGTFQVVVTAGAEKLSATHGAGVTASSAQPTATGSVTTAPPASGSSGIPQATNGAATLMAPDSLIMGLAAPILALMV